MKIDDDDDDSPYKGVPPPPPFPGMLATTLISESHAFLAVGLKTGKVICKSPYNEELNYSSGTMRDSDFTATRVQCEIVFLGCVSRQSTAHRDILN